MPVPSSVPSSVPPLPAPVVPVPIGVLCVCVRSGSPPLHRPRIKWGEEEDDWLVPVEITKVGCVTIPARFLKRSVGFVCRGVRCRRQFNVVAHPIVIDRTERDFLR